MLAFAPFQNSVKPSQESAIFFKCVRWA